MKTPEELYDFAYDYIFTVFAGISATILYNLLSSMLRSIGDSRTPLIFLAIAAALNIGLDFLFILGFHTGVAGAGYASVLSQGISGILCLIYMFKKYEIFRIRKRNGSYRFLAADGWFPLVCRWRCSFPLLQSVRLSCKQL